jgi:hypothetical protein
MACLLLAAAFLFALPVGPGKAMAAPPGPAWDETSPDLIPETPDRQLPLFVECTSPSTLADRVRELGGRVTYTYENFDALAITLPRAAVEELMADSRVESARRQRIVRRALTPLEFPEPRSLAGLRRRPPTGEEIARD